MAFKGTGGPPPGTNPGGSGGSRFKKVEYALFEAVAGGKEKKVNPFMLKAGEEDVEVIPLDRTDFEDCYTVRLHSRFKLNGTFSNHVVCLKGVDDQGCPLCDALNEPGKWFAVRTVLDGNKWEIPSGQRKGQVITLQRRLLLINSRQLDSFKKLGQKFGWRGQTYEVTRSNDEKSARIGTQWLAIPGGKLTDAQLLEKVKSIAETYGLTAEQYVEPFNYEKVLAPKSFEELTRIAKAIKAQEPSATPAEGAAAESSDEIPF